jgi:CubicO group peptidase (beta-lactamase class C family)
MRKPWMSLAALVVCGVFAGSTLLGLTPQPRQATAHEIGAAITVAFSGWLADQLTELRVPGAASAIVNRDTVTWEEVFGVTDGPGSAPITFDTIFCVRSISKSVTALAVLAAVQDGLVDLDTPIWHYLPEFSVKSRYEERPQDRITLRQMLGHRASFTHDPPMGINLQTPGYFERYIKTISDSWLKYPVGYRLYYSNYGYDLAAHVLQTLTRQPFADYVKEKVLDPIGMTHSTFDLDDAAGRPDRAVGHQRDGDVVPVPFPEIAAAGLYSTIRDMSKYAQFQLNSGVVDGRQIIRADLMEQYHSIQFAHRDQRTGYCMGLWREVVSNTVSFYHEGGGRGFGSHLIFYPELGIGIVTLTNMEYHGLTGYLGRRAMNGPIIEAYGDLPDVEARLDRMRRVDRADPRVQSVLGRYGDSQGATLGYENDVLGIRIDAERFFPMSFLDDAGELVAVYGNNTEARFLPPLGKKPGSMMTVNRRWDNHNSHYLEYNDSPHDPRGPNKSGWQQYVGEYDVIWEDNPSSTVAIEIRNGYVYFRDGKCDELEPGLFLHYDGEVIDLRTVPFTYANQEIRRRSG